MQHFIPCCGRFPALRLQCFCSPASKAKSDTRYFWQDDGSGEANLATVAYSQGDFDAAETHVIKALQIDPRQRQALMVGGLLYEQLGRPNRARQYYEDIIIYGGDATTILGTSSGTPEKMTDVAKKRLRLINVHQTKLIVEDENGEKVFNISEEGGQKQRRSAIEQALFRQNKKQQADQRVPSSAEQLEAVEVLFTPNEQNIISRFLILKELAEKDLITKEEFLTRRMANIGGLLPLTNLPPATAADKSVPSPDLIIERIGVLKDAVEARAITPQEFSAERDTIIEALLPPNPRNRLKRKSPPSDILEAAKDLRKLEMLQELGLITEKEKIKEKKEIEKHIGINQKAPAEKLPEKKMEVAETKIELQAPSESDNSDTVKTIVIEEVKEEAASSFAPSKNAIMPEPLIPNVSSPF